QQDGEQFLGHGREKFRNGITPSPATSAARPQSSLRSPRHRSAFLCGRDRDTTTACDRGRAGANSSLAPNHTSHCCCLFIHEYDQIAAAPILVVAGAIVNPPHAFRRRRFFGDGHHGRGQIGAARLGGRVGGGQSTRHGLRHAV